MKATTVAIFVFVNIWLASAKPVPQQAQEIIELLRGTLQGEHVDGINWPDKADVPSPDIPTEDEEKINERNGVSELPNVIGDIVLTPEQMSQLDIRGEGTAQAILKTKLWPGGVLPFRIDETLSSITARQIHSAMSELSARSCVQFVEVTYWNSWQYPNFVYFISGQGCYSYLGMIGRGKQPISIGRGCERKGIIQHEIFHALGRVHEQSRPDRDVYVNVVLKNVLPNRRNNFKIMSSSTQYLPYDYGSDMHYGRNDFSIRNGDPNYDTLIPKMPGVQIGQRFGLSQIDWNHLNQAYCSKATA